jgi:ERCC4-type nuclease
MKLKVDHREKKLIKLLEAFKTMHEFDFSIEVQELPLGDIILCDDDDTERLIIERKSVNDLAASLRDGRYREQSYRLTNGPVHNHNIIYLIEGDISKYSNKYTKIKPATLYVTMFCLQYYKGFSVIKTKDISETAQYILFMLDKMMRTKDKVSYYSTDGSCPAPPKNYCEVVNKVKKKNIRPENIGEIILSQIPGISSTTSLAIMSKFGSLYDLLMKLKEDQHCMDDMTYITSKGLTRRVSKSCISNIVQYLLYQKSNIIKVDT